MRKVRPWYTLRYALGDHACGHYNQEVKLTEMPRNKNLMQGVTLVPFSEKQEDGSIALTTKELRQAYKEVMEFNAQFAASYDKLRKLATEQLRKKGLLAEDEEAIFSTNFGRVQLGVRADGKPATKKKGRAARVAPDAITRTTKSLTL